MAWRDGSGRALQDYPHPSIAVDVALLTVQDGTLAVVVHERTARDPFGRYALPGTFVRIDETLHDAARRALRTKVQVTGQRPEQLLVFDDPARDDRGRVLSVAHVDLVPRDRLGDADVLLAPIAGAPPRPVLPSGHTRLAFDHDLIVEQAVAWARNLYRRAPDPRGLAGAEFTLLELQRVHEAITGHPLQKDTFRRRFRDTLDDTGRYRSGAVGKPARLHRRGATPEV
jgi:ADP-ribose pyrophosphatase YjhB (NUDIX family)